MAAKERPSEALGPCLAQTGCSLLSGFFPGEEPRNNTGRVRFSGPCFDRKANAHEEIEKHPRRETLTAMPATSNVILFKDRAKALSAQLPGRQTSILV